MAKPTVVPSRGEKIDHRKKKNPVAHEAWVNRKKQNRVEQVFIDTTRFNSSEEIEQLTDAQILALPKAHWEKVSE
jgi:hypothetical protein